MKNRMAPRTKAPLMAIVFSVVHGREYVGGSSTAARCLSAAGVYCIVIRVFVE